MKYKFIIFFVLLLSLTAVSAGDLNQSDAADYPEESFNSLTNKTESECCSFIIQEDGNETIYGFRQDAPLNGFGVQINNQTWNGLSIIREEIDTEGSYFTHCIIAENGWVMSQGGSQYGNNSLAIEALAGKMILSDNISKEDLGQVQSVLKKFDYGHFLIKSPDGRYGVAYSDEVHSGILLPGEFLAVPNVSFLFRGGNYKDYNSNPVDAINEICFYDDSGWNKRNFYSYYIRPHEVANSRFWGVDTFASNDNGQGAGLNVSHIVTHFYYNGAYYPPSAIPELPDKLYAGTYIFENQKIDGILCLTGKAENALVGKDLTINYKVYNIDEPCTVAFNLGDNIDFIDADISFGICVFDRSSHTLYWQVPGLAHPKEMSLVVRPKTKGNFTIRSYIENRSCEMNVTGYATDYGAVIKSDDVDVYKGYSHCLNITLKDIYGRSLAGENVTIRIGENTYVRQVTSDGFAALALMLDVGEYDAVISYDGIFGKNQTSAHISIKKTLFTEDVESFYNGPLQYNVSVIGQNGETLSGEEVDFKISGVLDDRYCDENGDVKFKIDLSPGNYTIRTFNIKTNEFRDNTIVIKSTIDADDLTVYYGDESKFKAAFLDANGNPLANSNVTFEINGTAFNGITDENGSCLLDIDLKPGKYTITTQNPQTSQSVTNSIVVLNKPIKTGISVKNLQTTYNSGKYLTATLRDADGNALRNVRLSISINGKIYNRATDSKGQARLLVNLVPKTYVAKITFAGNEKYVKSDAKAKVVVKKANVKLYAKNKKFKASKKIKPYAVTLKNNIGKPMAKVTLKLSIKGKTYLAKTNKQGKATFKISKLTKKATLKAKISFTGNKCYMPLKKSVKINVK